MSIFDVVCQLFAFGGAVLAVLFAAVFCFLALAAGAGVFGVEFKDKLREYIGMVAKFLLYYYPGMWKIAVWGEEQLSDLQHVARCLGRALVWLITAGLLCVLLFVRWVPLSEWSSLMGLAWHGVAWVFINHALWSIACLLALVGIGAMLAKISGMGERMASPFTGYYHWSKNCGDALGDLVYNGREGLLKWGARLLVWVATLLLLGVLGVALSGPATWLVINHGFTIGISFLVVVLVVVLLTLTPVLESIFRRGFGTRARDFLRNWAGPAPLRGIRWWLLSAGDSAAEGLLHWWRQSVPPTVPPTRPLHKVVAFRLMAWTPFLLLNLVLIFFPWLPTSEERKAAGTTAGAGSGSAVATPNSGSGSGGPPADPGKAAAQPPVVVNPPKPVDPPKPKLGAQLARELITNLQAATKRGKGGIEMKVPARYTEDDVTDALEMINDSKKSVDAGIPAGFVATQPSKGWVRVTPPGDDVGEIEKIGK